MGTTVALIGPDPGRKEAGDPFELAAEGVRFVFTELDSRFSRFRTDSELSRINARAGRWTRTSRPFSELLAFSLQAAGETDGLFDPTVLPALVAAGYDRDFELLHTGLHAAPESPPPAGRWTQVRVDGSKVWLPSGAALDFGGVAKGWAVDRAISACCDLTWAVIDAGGDLRVTGEVPEGGVDVAIEDPFARGQEVLRLKLESGALATSSVLSRSWGPGLHQLIDPRTARPARTGVVQATVWASTCADAEILAKWVLLAGPAGLDRVPGVLVMDDDRLVVNVEQANGAVFEQQTVVMA
jgi:FAD:protein FMN transferase